MHFLRNQVFGKLYVTKPVFGRDIGGLLEIIIIHFFMVVNPFS